MTKTVLHSVLEHVASKAGDHPAVEEPGRTISHAALNAAANRAAGSLIDRYGLTKGDVVALDLPVGIDFVSAMLAVAKAGGTVLPLDANAPPRRQAQILGTAAPRLAIGRAPAGLSDDVPVLDPAWLTNPGENAEAGASDRPRVAEGEDPCYIVCTSGSTGTPKAIVGTHKGLSHFVHWEVGEFALNADVRVSQLAPPTFDVSLRDIFVPLLAGGTLCIPPDEARANSRRLLDWLEAARITLMHCVPSLFRQLLLELEGDPAPDRRLPALSHVLLAGEPLYAGDVQRWRECLGRRVELINLYGPSETTLAKAFHRIDTVANEPGRMVPVGQALPNTALLVIKNGELCDPGEIGELFIKTPFMTKGYLNAPEETAAAFVQNPLTPGVPDTVYRTGDLGRYVAGHAVELLGRKDGQVKINGIRIETAEIEAAMMRHSAVDQAVVVAHGHGRQEPALTGYYTARGAVSAQDLRAALGDWLSQAMMPAFFIQMDEFPVNLHGKVNRRALPQPAGLLYRARAAEEPADEIERQVAAVWDEVLELGRIGVTHGFVELGGDSLKAIRVLSRLFQAFGVEVKLQDLFPHASVRELAAKIAARQLEAGHHQAAE